jgi:Tfp pilus assembly protein PilF
MSYQDPEDTFVPSPVRESANNLANALFDLITAKSDLDEAIKNVPSYTAQYDDAHFYRHEQKIFNKACNAYEDAVVASNKAST